MRLSLKGFKNPPTSASTQQTPATGSGGGAGTLDADLMSLSAPMIPQLLGLAWARNQRRGGASTVPMVLSLWR